MFCFKGFGKGCRAITSVPKGLSYLGGGGGGGGGVWGKGIS